MRTLNIKPTFILNSKHNFVHSVIRFKACYSLEIIYTMMAQFWPLSVMLTYRDAVTAMVEKFSERGARSCPASLFAVYSVQGLVDEQPQETRDICPLWTLGHKAQHLNQTNRQIKRGRYAARATIATQNAVYKQMKRGRYAAQATIGKTNCCVWTISEHKSTRCTSLC